MIIQVDTNKQTLNAQGEITRSVWYAMRILRCSANMTVAWNSPKDQITALAGSLYQSRRGITGLWVQGAGTIILEYTDDPNEIGLPPISVAGANLDGAGNTIVTGPVAAGGALGADAPVKVGGTDGANVRALLTDAAGRVLVSGAAGKGAAAAGNPLLMGVVDINNTMRWLASDTGGNLVPRGNILPTNPFFMEHAPAAATIATLTIPAAGVGLSNYITDLEIELACGAAASGILTVTLTGVMGALTKTYRLQAAANGIDRLVLSGVLFRSDLNTAMTLAFGAAGPAGSFEKVSASGFVGNSVSGGFVQ